MVAQRAASARIRLLLGGNMKVGDLVHVPRYPYWGMGVVVEVGRPQDGLLIYWFDDTDTTWLMKEGLEKL